MLLHFVTFCCRYGLLSLLHVIRMTEPDLTMQPQPTLPLQVCDVSVTCHFATFSAGMAY
jgi:hypothetical protein